MSRGPLYDQQVGLLRVSARNPDGDGLCVLLDITHPECEYRVPMTASDARQLAQALSVAAARAEQAGTA